jgi:hypothetical protein
VRGAPLGTLFCGRVKKGRTVVGHSS